MSDVGSETGAVGAGTTSVKSEGCAVGRSVVVVSRASVATSGALDTKMVVGTSGPSLFGPTSTGGVMILAEGTEGTGGVATSTDDGPVASDATAVGVGSISGSAILADT